MRLFLALWPDAACRSELVAHADRWSWTAQARRTRVESLHATLHFIGEVAAERLPHLRDGLATQWTGGELVLDRATVWPGGIAVLEASDVPPALAALHADLAMRLGGLGLPAESRPYRLHVTLARKATGAVPPAFAPIRWQAGPTYALVQSAGGGRGYETLQAFG